MNFITKIFKHIKVSPYTDYHQLFISNSQKALLTANLSSETREEERGGEGSIVGGGGSIIQTVELNMLEASHIGKLKLQLTTIYIIRNRKKLQIDKSITVFKIIQTNQYIIEYKLLQLHYGLLCYAA